MSEPTMTPQQTVSSTAPAPEPARDGRHSRKSRALELGESLGLVALLIAVIVFFRLLPSTSGLFLSTANVQVTIGNQVILAVAAIAGVLVLAGGRYDLSIGAVLGICAFADAKLMSGSH